MASGAESDSVLLAKVVAELDEAESRGLRGRVAALRRLTDILTSAAHVRRETARRADLAGRVSVFVRSSEPNAEVRATALRLLRVLVDEESAGASNFGLLEAAETRTALGEALGRGGDEQAAALELVELYVAEREGSASRRAGIAGAVASGLAQALGGAHGERALRVLEQLVCAETREALVGAGGALGGALGRLACEDRFGARAVRLLEELSGGEEGALRAARRARLSEGEGGGWLGGLLRAVEEGGSEEVRQSAYGLLRRVLGGGGGSAEARAQAWSVLPVSFGARGGLGSEMLAHLIVWEGASDAAVLSRRGGVEELVRAGESGDWVGEARGAVLDAALVRVAEAGAEGAAWVRERVLGQLLRIARVRAAPGEGDVGGRASAVLVRVSAGRWEDLERLAEESGGAGGAPLSLLRGAVLRAAADKAVGGAEQADRLARSAGVRELLCAGLAGELAGEGKMDAARWLHALVEAGSADGLAALRTSPELVRAAAAAAECDIATAVRLAGLGAGASAAPEVGRPLLVRLARLGDAAAAAVERNLVVGLLRAAAAWSDEQLTEDAFLAAVALLERVVLPSWSARDADWAAAWFAAGAPITAPVRVCALVPAAVVRAATALAGLPHTSAAACAWLRDAVASDHRLRRQVLAVALPALVDTVLALDPVTAPLVAQTAAELVRSLPAAEVSREAVAGLARVAQRACDAPDGSVGAAVAQAAVDALVHVLRVHDDDHQDDSAASAPAPVALDLRGVLDAATDLLASPALAALGVRLVAALAADGALDEAGPAAGGAAAAPDLVRRLLACDTDEAQAVVAQLCEAADVSEPLLRWATGAEAQGAAADGALALVVRWTAAAPACPTTRGVVRALRADVALAPQLLQAAARLRAPPVAQGVATLLTSAFPDAAAAAALAPAAVAAVASAAHLDPRLLRLLALARSDDARRALVASRTWASVLGAAARAGDELWTVARAVVADAAHDANADDWRRALVASDALVARLVAVCSAPAAAPVDAVHVLMALWDVPEFQSKLAPYIGPSADGSDGPTEFLRRAQRPHGLAPSPPPLAPAAAAPKPTYDGRDGPWDQSAAHLPVSSAVINGTERLKSTTAFAIDVTRNASACALLGPHVPTVVTVVRRFSDFEALVDELARASASAAGGGGGGAGGAGGGASLLPPMPKGGISKFFKKNKESTVAKRVLRFGAILQAILDDPALRANSAFREFCTPGPDDVK